MTARTPGGWPGLALLSMAHPSDSRIVGPAPEALTEARACATQASQATQATQAPAAQATQAPATGHRDRPYARRTAGHTPAASHMAVAGHRTAGHIAAAQQATATGHMAAAGHRTAGHMAAAQQAIPPPQAIWPPQATARQVIRSPHSRPPWQAIPHTAGHTLAARQTTVAGHPQGVALLYTAAGAVVYSRATPCGWPAGRWPAGRWPVAVACCAAGLPRTCIVGPPLAGGLRSGGLCCGRPTPGGWPVRGPARRGLRSGGLCCGRPTPGGWPALAPFAAFPIACCVYSRATPGGWPAQRGPVLRSAHPWRACAAVGPPCGGRPTPGGWPDLLSQV